MGLLTWIVVGAIAGWLAGKLMRGRGFGLLGNILVGVLGAIVGGWLAGSLLNLPDPISGFNVVTLLVALGGSVLILFVLGLFRRR